jgi:hypothetical protein
MSGDELMVAIYKAILEALESRLHLIGSVLDGDARRLTLERGIYDKGDFYNNFGYLVTVEGDGITLHVGSNVRHESFVLGGKVSSWTPLAPLKAWVERKHLSWQDKKTGLDLTVEQIAYLIRGKIKREGIPERNVVAEVIEKRESWIIRQLDDIRVVLA